MKYSYVTLYNFLNHCTAMGTVERNDKILYPGTYGLQVSLQVLKSTWENLNMHYLESLDLWTSSIVRNFK
jgi:hypothetical protein